MVKTALSNLETVIFHYPGQHHSSITGGTVPTLSAFYFKEPSLRRSELTWIYVRAEGSFLTVVFTKMIP